VRVMPRKISPLLIVILALVVIGLFSQMTNPVQLIIPVVVLGAIFLLYKFPPGPVRAKTKTKTQPRQSAAQSKPKTRKNVPFRVIEGGKDDDNLPKYH
jgi:hypothetical protein